MTPSKGVWRWNRAPGFDEHLDECPACATYLNQLRITLDGLERLPRPKATSERRSELIAAFQRELKKKS